MYGGRPGGFTARGARRAAMRECGIPTSQQPISQRSVRTPRGTPAGRQYNYQGPASGGGTKNYAVQQSLTDNVADHGPHYEAGPVKPGGQVDSLGRPRLIEGDKAKAMEGPPPTQP